jgi:hypothetical protein
MRSFGETSAFRLDGKSGMPFTCPRLDIEQLAAPLPERGIAGRSISFA